MTRFHSRTFFAASGLLLPVKRRAVRALYAFCRVTDDLVDREVAEGDNGCVLTKSMTAAPPSMPGAH